MKRFRAAFISLAVVFNVHSGATEGNFLGIDNSPPGQFRKEIPEPDIEFWGTMKRL